MPHLPPAVRAEFLFLSREGSSRPFTPSTVLTSKFGTHESLSAIFRFHPHIS
ncbi:unnamed protein product [Ectocarpus sp. CCAP 1310/34]|nr:unnamed protein product [Ectocarpus sp. CCAP 1310/34]